MISFLSQYWGRITTTLLVIASLLFFIFTSSSLKGRMTGTLFYTSQTILRPVSRSITTVQTWSAYQIQFFLRQRVLNEEVVSLQKENAFMRKQIDEFRGTELELYRIRKLLDLKQQLPSQTVASEVIATAPSNYYLTLILDKGAKEGISRNMVVVNEDGAIGRVLQVGPHSSKVLLIADQRSAVSVMLEKTQSRAILEGMGSGLCKLVLEDQQVKINKGDRIVTSGLGGVFPKGLFVGVIDEIKRDPRSGWATSIIVRPAADNYSIQEALIIVNPVIPPVDTKALEEK